MRFLPIVLGWIIATTALSAIVSLSASEADPNAIPTFTTG